MKHESRSSGELTYVWSSRLGRCQLRIYDFRRGPKPAMDIQVSVYYLRPDVRKSTAFRAAGRQIYHGDSLPRALRKLSLMLYAKSDFRDTLALPSDIQNYLDEANEE